MSSPFDGLFGPLFEPPEPGVANAPVSTSAYPVDWAAWQKQLAREGMAWQLFHAQNQKRKQEELSKLGEK